MQLTAEQLSKRLEEGVREVYQSDSYRKHLQAVSRFHQYSWGNTILILSQKPDATYVAGYQTWNTNFNRHVRKGEKAIRILTPVLQKDEEDENGERKLCGFRCGNVFDISQTEGEEIPLHLAETLNFQIRDYQNFINALILVSPVPVSFEDVKQANGYYHPLEKRICIRSNLPQAQTVKTLIHEITHAVLHSADTSADHESRQRREIEAESVAYIVSARFGIDASSYSFGYIASWAENRSTELLKESLDTIQKTASKLISLLECVLFPSAA